MIIKIADSIELISLSEEHATDIFRILDSEREYMRIWLPFVDETRTVEDNMNAIKMLTSGIDVQFSIFFENNFVGLVGFKGTDLDNQRTEIGYWLSQKAQKRGIMTCAVNALVNYAFDEMKMNRIQIRVAVKNIPSRSIPERLGFTLEGIERDGELLVDNQFTDIAVYSLLKREYKKIIRCKL